jgi:hypothetical protein
MSSIDAPDWEHISVTVEAMGDVPDAPDWEHIVVGPGGTPVGGGGISAVNVYPYPTDYGYAGWTTAPDGAGFANNKPTSGHIYYGTFKVINTQTVSNMYMLIDNTGGTFTAGESGINVYSGSPFSGGSLVGSVSSAAAINVYENTTVLPSFQPLPFSSSFSVTAGEFLYILWLCNAGTMPSLGFSIYPPIEDQNGVFIDTAATTAGGNTALTPVPAITAFQQVTPRLWFAIG